MIKNTTVADWNTCPEVPATASQVGGFSWTHCALNEVLDLGREEMDSFWQDYVLEWSSLHIDSGASLEDARFFMKWTYILTQTEEAGL